MRNHEKAFGQMKAYYNDITNDNLKARFALTYMRRQNDIYVSLF